MDERELDEWQLLQAVCDPRKRGPMQRAGRELDSVGAGWDPRQDAARKRLRECSDHQQACEAIREIVSNLMGCEEMALLRLDCGSGRASQRGDAGSDRRGSLCVCEQRQWEGGEGGDKCPYTDPIQGNNRRGPG